MKKTLLLALTCASFQFSACSQKDDDNIASTPEPVNMMAEPESKPGKIVIGIASCDEFLDKYRACLDQLPAGIQSTMKDGLQKTEQAWLMEARKEDNELKLSQACMTLDESTSVSMRAQGCSW